MITRTPIATALLCALSACSQPPPRHLDIRVGSVILDNTHTLGPTRITIDDGVITALAPDGDPSSQPTAHLESGEGVIDARDMTAVPGAIQVVGATPGCLQDLGPSALVDTLATALASGTTTLATVNAPTHFATALRAYVGTARSRGPRILVTGSVLVVDNLAERGDETLANEVRQRAEDGVDLVALSPPTSAEAAPRRAVCILLDEAQRQDLRVLWLGDEISLERTKTCPHRGDIGVFAAGTPATSCTGSLDVATTQDNARTVGLEDALGQIAVGYRADLAFYRGRLGEITPLNRPALVIVDGVVQEPERTNPLRVIPLLWARLVD